MTPSDFLTRLKKVKATGDSWMATCPAHDDRKQSLHVSLGSDGRILLTCHAGCKAQQIVERLGLKMSDLFTATAPARQPSKIVAQYDYRDERGELLFQTVRKAPKDFYQRHPDGRGGWVNSLNGTRRVLYRLPELLAADVAQAVLIVEGEKDVDAAQRLGFVATTSPMGAGKWRADYADFLAGRPVVIIPDNDKPGRAHAEAIAATLQGKAMSVKIVELPGLAPKGDLSDWIAMGGARTDLEQLISQAKEAGAEYVHGNGAEQTPKPADKQPKPTDDELRDRWLSGHELTAFGLGEFRRYAAGCWPAIAKEQIQSEIALVIEQAKSEGIRPTAGLLKSVFELARVKLFVPDKRWDADPDLLVMANGALHLPTRTLREHAPADHVTLALPYAFDPEAAAPVWDYFLASTVPDSADFFQEFAGYALTTDTRYEIALWFVGEAGSGKSTGIMGLETMLGPKVCQLGLADIEKSRFALAGLPGKTLAKATEQPSLFIQASHVLNALISGEPVTIERKYEDAYTFTPHVKIVWAMNELPRVADTTNGLFRRVKVVRFRPLPEAERDPKVKLAIANEGPGILNWALAGLARLQARGRFEVPSSVREATDHFQQTNDVPALFVADACLTGADYRVQSADLYGAYRNWCEANGHRSQSATSMAAEWERLGFEKYKSSGKAYYRGIGLTSPLMP